MFDFDDMETSGKEELPLPKAERIGNFVPTKDTVKKVLAEVGERFNTSENWENKDVLFKIESGVATITLNRSARYNQFSDDMMEGFLDALVELHNSVGKARVVVVRTATPGVPFCAGMDVEEAAANDVGATEEDIIKGGMKSAYVYYLFSTLPQYVIGMVTGPCMGAGIGFCCTMDLAICLNKPFVNFKFVETTFGMVCVSWVHVVNKIGAPKARMAICQNMTATPTDAKELGIVHQLCNERDDMEKMLKDVIEKNCNATAPGTVAHAKHYLMDLSGTAPNMDKLRWTAEQMAMAVGGEEKAVGGAAFVKKEKPPWEKNALVAPKPNF